MPVLPVRPPGSVPEQEFLQMCIRCGECYQACPSDVLQPLGFQQDWKGSGRRRLSLIGRAARRVATPAVKSARPGNPGAAAGGGKRRPVWDWRSSTEQTCLPFAEREACQLCVDECVSAGYRRD